MCDFRKGSTFLEYTTTGVLLTFLILIIVSLFMKRYTLERCDFMADTIARDIVFCDNLSDAQAKAEADLLTYNIPFTKNMTVMVTYAAGSKTEWKKGCYISIVFECKIVSFLNATETWHRTEILKMIEKSGESLP